MLTSEHRGRGDNEPSGEAMTLWGKINPKQMGDRAGKAKPKELTDKLDKAKKRCVYTLRPRIRALPLPSVTLPPAGLVTAFRAPGWRDWRGPAR